MINQEEYEILKKCDGEFKWVARDKNRKLWAYTKKPDKGVHSWGRVVNVDFLPRHSKDLFQFIQWEDEEPHEIAGLIREYEIKELRLAPSGTVIVDSFDESEETEAKDKKWLKEKVETYLSNWWSESDDDMHDLMDNVKHLINQLDEPEVPVVPEDVYEHIKMNKAGGVPLDIALDGAIGKLEILGRDGIQFHEFRNNQDNYARAWLAYPNIEIEEEPLFYVELIEGAYLEYYPRSGNFGITGHKEDNHGLVKLTEDRIKSLPKGDVLFEHFALKVEEIEE